MKYTYQDITNKSTQIIYADSLKEARLVYKSFYGLPIPKIQIKKKVLHLKGIVNGVRQCRDAT